MVDFLHVFGHGMMTNSIDLRRARWGLRSVQGGVSFLEVIVVMAIMAVLMGIVIPEIRSFIKSARLSTQATELVSDIAFARTEAATRGRRVTMCVSTDSSTCAGSGTAWTSGRIIFVDLDANGVRANTEPMLRVGGITSEDATITVSDFANDEYISFMPYGGLMPATAGDFKICLTDWVAGRGVEVSINGRPVIKRDGVTCP